MTKPAGPSGIIPSFTRRQRRRSWASSPLGGVVIAVGFSGGAWAVPFSPLIGGGLLAVSVIVSCLVVIDIFSR